MATIIRTDNYGRSGEWQGRDETLVVACISADLAKRVHVLLNEECPEDWVYAIVPDGYTLQRFEP